MALVLVPLFAMALIVGFAFKNVTAIRISQIPEDCKNVLSVVPFFLVSSLNVLRLNERCEDVEILILLPFVDTASKVRPRIQGLHDGMLVCGITCP
jgi:hypothetical protein